MPSPGFESPEVIHLSQSFAFLFLFTATVKNFRLHLFACVDLINKTLVMRKILLLAGSFLWLSALDAQLTTLPDGGNKKAMVAERVGITDVIINYNRPGVKGREGKIWGQLVPAGFNDLGFGSSKAAPWRAGSNENTTIQFSDDVMIEGKPLPAGKYGFFIAYDADECTLIFSKNSTSWGSFFYDEKEDALRVKVKPVALDKSVEWLRYEFTNETENSATVALEWEKLAIPFKVEVDYVKTQLESFRRELRSEKSFNPGWQSYQQAAQFTINRNVDLEEGLKWADQSISEPFIGQANFVTLSTKATILSKLGREKEADSIMKQALPMGSMAQLHAYARQLLQQKRAKDALEVFQLNYKKNPNQFTTLVGLTRGYSANGDFKNALKYAQLALPLSPPGPNKTSIENMIEKLKKNEDVN
jgi:tetratricopeptide (TPR) repeat protein